MSTEKQCATNYDDILELPHHVSVFHPHMPLSDRAAQFSPFSALTGYEDAVREERRLTCPKTELEEDVRRLLDEKLQSILTRKEPPRKTIFTCFRQDDRKEGGACVTISGYVKKWDPYERCVVLEDGRSIPAAEIMAIQDADAKSI